MASFCFKMVVTLLNSAGACLLILDFCQPRNYPIRLFSAPKSNDKCFLYLPGCNCIKRIRLLHYTNVLIYSAIKFVVKYWLYAYHFG